MIFGLPLIMSDRGDALGLCTFSSHLDHSPAYQAANRGNEVYDGSIVLQTMMLAAMPRSRASRIITGLSRSE